MHMCPPAAFLLSICLVGFELFLPPPMFPSSMFDPFIAARRYSARTFPRHYCEIPQPNRLFPSFSYSFLRLPSPCLLAVPPPPPSAFLVTLYGVRAICFSKCLKRIFFFAFIMPSSSSSFGCLSLRMFLSSFCLQPPHIFFVPSPFNPKKGSKNSSNALKFTYPRTGCVSVTKRPKVTA